MNLQLDNRNSDLFNKCLAITILKNNSLMYNKNILKNDRFLIFGHD